MSLPLLLSILVHCSTLFLFLCLNSTTVSTGEKWCLWRRDTHTSLLMMDGLLPLFLKMPACVCICCIGHEPPEPGAGDLSPGRPVQSGLRTRLCLVDQQDEHVSGFQGMPGISGTLYSFCLRSNEHFYLFHSSAFG